MFGIRISAHSRAVVEDHIGLNDSGKVIHRCVNVLQHVDQKKHII